jgi:membrane-associated phospholipid phosphatase
MTSFEWLTIGYLAALTAAGWWRGSPQRLRMSGYTALATALVIVARFAAPWGVRVWLPHAYLMLGYWLPALLTRVPPGDRFEQWLRTADARLWPGVWRIPAWSGHWFEIAYLLCYPIVPISFIIVRARGSDDEVTRFWLAVLGAGFACYGTLPWTAAWPPRVHSARAVRGVAAFNLHVLRRFSHGFNTFPSGHVAVAVAAALAVSAVSPEAGAAIGLVAVSIAIAAVLGRYHYAVDVIGGLLVGVLARLITNQL